MKEDFLLCLNRCKHKLSYPNTLKSLLGQHRCSEEKDLIKLAIELEKYKCALGEQRSLIKHKRKLSRMLVKGTSTTESWKILTLFVQCSIDNTFKTKICEYFKAQTSKNQDVRNIENDKTQQASEKHNYTAQEDSKHIEKGFISSVGGNKRITMDQGGFDPLECNSLNNQNYKTKSFDISRNLKCSSGITALFDKLPKYDSFFHDILLESCFKTETVLGISLNFQTRYQYQEYVAGRVYGDLRSFNCQLIECVGKIEKIQKQMANMKILKGENEFSRKPLETIGTLNKAVNKLTRYISFLENNLINCEQVKLLREDCMIIREYLRGIVQPLQKIKELRLTGPLSSYIQNYSVEDMALRNRLKKRIFTAKLPLLPMFYDLAFDHISF